VSTRCRNCGTTEHYTQNCGEYGPWYPEPGKTGQDYGELTNKIDKLVAEDIFREHQEMHEDQEAAARLAASPEVAQAIDDFLKHPETGEIRTRPGGKGSLPKVQ
jgi:hypothetical protein